MRSSWSAGADDEGGTSTRRAETRGKKAPVVRRKGTGSTKSEFLFPAYRPVCSQRGCLSGKVSRAQKDREERELFGCPKTRYTPRSPPAPKRRRLEKSLRDAGSRLNSVETPDCWSEILTRVCAGMLCCARPFSLYRCVEPLREKSSFHLQEEARGYDAACSVAVAVLSPLWCMQVLEERGEQ